MLARRDDTFRLRLVATRRAVICIALVGGSSLFRAGLRLLVERDPSLRIIANGRTAAEAFNGNDVSALDIVLVDADDGDADGTVLVRQVRAATGNAGILVLASKVGHAVATPLVRNGARGLVSKDAPPDLLRLSIRKVRDGELWLDRATTSQIILDMANEVPAATKSALAMMDSLTLRERDVVELITTGMSNKAIARKLAISDNTVRHHVTSIFAKLGVHDRMGLVLFALERNIAKPRV